MKDKKNKSFEIAIAGFRYRIHVTDKAITAIMMQVPDELSCYVGNNCEEHNFYGVAKLNPADTMDVHFGTYLAATRALSKFIGHVQHVTKYRIKQVTAILWHATDTLAKRAPGLKDIKKMRSRA